MTRKCVDDAKYGQLWRRVVELVRRVAEGTLPLDKMMTGLQALIDSRFSEGIILPTWKIIKLGTGLKTADDFRKALRAIGVINIDIHENANNMLGKLALRASARKREIELVKVSVAELGFRNGATRQEIYRRAQKLGLKLCPPEVGPQLRLQYRGQPYGEWLLIGMEPIAPSAAGPRVFYVGRGGGRRRLSVYCADHGVVWCGGSQCLFLRHR